jgi:hypothetical protein
MKRTLFILMLSLFFTGAYAGDGCKPVSCTTSFKDYMGNERQFTRFWIYDTLGRLVLDSVNAPDSVWASPIYTEHYRYSDDSIIGTGRYTGTMVISLVNNSDLPSICELPHGARYHALYNADKKLEKVITARTGINEKGKTDVIYSTIDSITYFEGNIISYQFTGMVNYKVNCTYLKDTLYKQDFSATDKLLALIGRPDEVPGFLNVQVFSKELLSSEESGYTKTYAYQLDDHGKVVGIDKTYNSGVAGTRTSITHYEFKYECN